MAIHSSTLAWKIPWREEPGRLQSMGWKELNMTEWLNWTVITFTSNSSNINTKYLLHVLQRGFPHSSVGKVCACSEGDLGSIPGSGRSPGEGNGNPLQYSCLENPMDRGAWRATVHKVSRVGHNLVTKPPPPPRITKTPEYPNHLSITYLP